MTRPHDQANALLGLLAETPLHAGAGAGIGVIDLPIQREAHTGYPCIYGSAVKGALRALADTTMETNLRFAVFGPDTDGAAEHAGALQVGDARLLLLPVRSLTSHYRWVTCPYLLERLARDAARLGLSLLDGVPLPRPSGEEAHIHGNAEDLFLEEYRFTAVRSDLQPLAGALHRLCGEAVPLERLLQQLTVIDDDLFAHLARFATPVAPHIRIDSATRTVAKGALWYEETLPPDTLLYVPLNAVSSRRKGTELEPGAILEAVTGLFSSPEKSRPWLQVGGNETTGMGWCRVSILTPGKEASHG